MPAQIVVGGRTDPDLPNTHVLPVQALMKSQVFCPLVSEGAIAKMAPLVNCGEDWVDNVLLEYLLALVLLSNHKVKTIHPVFVGEVDSRGFMPLELPAILETLSDKPSVKTVEEALQHLRNANCSGYLTESFRCMSVRDIVEAVCSHPGTQMHELGMPDNARRDASQQILECVTPLRQVKSKGKSDTWCDAIFSSLPDVMQAPASVSSADDTASRQRAGQLQQLLVQLLKDSSGAPMEQQLYHHMQRQLKTRLQQSTGDTGYVDDDALKEGFQSNLACRLLPSGNHPVLEGGFERTSKPRYTLYQVRTRTGANRWHEQPPRVSRCAFDYACAAHLSFASLPGFCAHRNRQRNRPPCLYP